ncbi:MAG: exodeoxyribonuclease VII small subunit [Pelagibacteraceae bacterium TMED65]|nr:exodeoxyribonuclease VII small subunit [Rickettsiales bacterium]OUU52169.1 MAG: exodeoxyribonuclease VII small subunit [Pelagibacteraceae bacterium TMED65]|tara:strand:- start:786 stop:1019 length:234 start_codon:yes stop_codon:yes gene_type:complete
MTNTIEKKLDELSYEEAFEKLQNIVKLLEEGKVSLDESIKYYEQGIILKNHCEKKLKNAEVKIKNVLNKSEKNSSEI